MITSNGLTLLEVVERPLEIKEPVEGVGTSVCPIEFADDIDYRPPEELWALHQPGTSKWGCYNDHGVHGLAVFRTEQDAITFCREYIDLSGLQSFELKEGLDEAREIAKCRPPQVVAVMLLEQISGAATAEFQPVFTHYVR